MEKLTDITQLQLIFYKYLVFSNMIADVSKNRTSYRFHIGSLEEKLRREDDDLMTSACGFNGKKYRSYGKSSFFTDLPLLTFSRKKKSYT